MKAISGAKHQLLLTALSLIEQALPDADVPDGYGEQLRILSELFNRYEQLLCELGANIREYQTLQRSLKTQVLAPALRKAKRQASRSKGNGQEWLFMGQFVKALGEQ